MRRSLVAAAIIATALFAGTGCTGDPAGTAGASPAGTVTASPTGGPGTSPGAATGTAGGNAKEICAVATKAGSDAVQVFVQELAKMVEAAGAGDTKARQAAERNAEAALDGWAAVLKEQAGRADDARLRAVLIEISAEVGAMKADIESVDDTKLGRLRQRLDQLCGT
jgi:hypothetical protein